MPSTFAVIGATSAVGRAVGSRLRESGHDVRGISRSLGVAVEDADAMAAALRSVAGVFVMIPFDLSAPDLHRREDGFGEQVETALRAAGSPPVVLLSGLNAHLARGTSLGAALMERRLLDGGYGSVKVLRAGWFMENFTGGLNLLKQAPTGQFATPFRPDRPVPMVAAGDVGVRAADLMMGDEHEGAHVIELHGASDHTFSDATSVLAAAWDLGPVSYEWQGEEAARRTMKADGLPTAFSEAIIETARTFNEGLDWALEARTPQNSSGTSLALWARKQMGISEAAS